MEPTTEHYKYMLEQFIRDCPMWANDIVSYTPKHLHAIRITLRNGDQLDYNGRSGSFRFVNQHGSEPVDNVTDDECRHTFASNLAELMQMRGMGQSYLAARTGLSSAMISKYLNQKATPSVTNLRNIARVLNCHIDELIE